MSRDADLINRTRSPTGGLDGRCCPAHLATDHALSTSPTRITWSFTGQAIGNSAVFSYADAERIGIIFCDASYQELAGSHGGGLCP
jgi:hypothetical protein